MSDHHIDANKLTPLIRYTGLMTMPDGTQQSIHFYRVEDVEAMLEEYAATELDDAALEWYSPNEVAVMRFAENCSPNSEVGHEKADSCVLQRNLRTVLCHATLQTVAERIS